MFFGADQVIEIVRNRRRKRAERKLKKKQKMYLYAMRRYVVVQRIMYNRPYNAENQRQ